MANLCALMVEAKKLGIKGKKNLESLGNELLGLTSEQMVSLLRAYREGLELRRQAQIKRELTERMREK